MGQIRLDSEVRFLPGVGPRRAEHLAQLGVHTVEELLEYVPFRHGYQGPQQPIGQLREGQSATVVGELADIELRGRYPRRSLLGLLEDETGTCLVRWFNAPYLLDKLALGQRLRLHGKVKHYDELPQFVNPKLEILSGSEPAVQAERFEPVYPATAELSSRHIGRLVSTALAASLQQVREWYEPDLRRARQLATRRWAIQHMHHPSCPKDIAQARRRLAYDELLLLQLAMALRRRRAAESAQAYPIAVDDRLDARIRRRLPFSLTAAQKRVIRQIVADLARTRPMNRLLQGDVGSGKTAVAIYAALAAVARGCQVAMMAPTEILADQHHQKISQYLQGSKVRWVLLRGGLTGSQRTQLLERIATGQVDVVVGTHALIQRDVRFNRLGLVIVDEQHRFGVAQRAVIRAKGVWPHYLVMTATPIPRTLALTVFGDLDVSVIDELPPGRQPIETRVIYPKQVPKAYEFVRGLLASGQQAYVVYPLLDESDASPLPAAAAELDRLAAGPFAGWPVGLLHGQMKPAQKQQVMAQFTSGRLAVLVATTVVEVGIDVPNATVMMVQNAERFGLSQLHQLRGRIGRGSERSYCLLVAGSNNHSADGRLSVLAKTSDGFQIAEEDLRLRGPGQVAGIRQHGLPELRVADLLRDAKLLETARADARHIAEADGRLTEPKHAALRSALIRRFGKNFTLIDVA